METMSLNLPENSDSPQQQEILDALPVLVFLEREGEIVFANVEARQMLGLADEPWVSRQVEDVLWGLFPGTAEPQTLLTGTMRGSPFHATLPARNGRLLPVEGTYCLLNPELREAVIVADTATDPLWKNLQDFAAACGIRASWALPILHDDGTVLGVVTLYYQEPHEPEDWDWSALNSCIKLIRLALAAELEWDKQTRTRFLACAALPGVAAPYAPHGIFALQFQGANPVPIDNYIRQQPTVCGCRL